MLECYEVNNDVNTNHGDRLLDTFMEILVCDIGSESIWYWTPLVT